MRIILIWELHVHWWKDLRSKRFRACRHLKQETQEEILHAQAEAKKNPKKYFSIIIDGMDQKKTNCPSLGKQSKDELPLVQLVFGVKVYGFKTYAFICDHFKTYAFICDQNLHFHLDKIFKLPSEDPVLYLQFDNCGENKNNRLLKNEKCTLPSGQKLLTIKIRTIFLFCHRGHASPLLKLGRKCSVAPICVWWSSKNY